MGIDQCANVPLQIKNDLMNNNPMTKNMGIYGYFFNTQIPFSLRALLYALCSKIWVFMGILQRTISTLCAPYHAPCVKHKYNQFPSKIHAQKPISPHIPLYRKPAHLYR